MGETLFWVKRYWVKRDWVKRDWVKRYWANCYHTFFWNLSHLDVILFTSSRTRKLVENK